MKRTSKSLLGLTISIAVVAFCAAGLGVLWQGEGLPIEFGTLRGEAVMIQGHGLYRYDSVSLWGGSY